MPKQVTGYPEGTLLRRIAATPLSCVAGRLLALAVLTAIVRVAVHDEAIRNGARSAYLSGALVFLVFYGSLRLRYPANRQAAPWRRLLGLLRWVAGNACALWRPTRAAPLVDASALEFSFTKRSNYSAVFAMWLLVLLVDVPVAHLVLSSTDLPAAVKLVVQCYVLGLSLAALVVLIGDRRRLGPAVHVLTRETLHVRLGGRVRCDVPVADIASVRRLDASEAKALSGGCSKRPPGLICVAMADKPNVLVGLSGPGVAVTLGVSRSVSGMALFLDTPEAFVHALNERLSGRGQAAPVEAPTQRTSLEPAGAMPSAFLADGSPPAS